LAPGGCVNPRPRSPERDFRSPILGKNCDPTQNPHRQEREYVDPGDNQELFRPTGIGENLPEREYVYFSQASQDIDRCGDSLTRFACGCFARDAGVAACVLMYSVGLERGLSRACFIKPSRRTVDFKSNVIPRAMSEHKLSSLCEQAGGRYLYRVSRIFVCGDGGSFGISASECQPGRRQLRPLFRPAVFLRLR
jgi:hypothetical protein